VVDPESDQMKTITAIAAKGLGKFLAKDFRQIFGSAATGPRGTTYNGLDGRHSDGVPNYSYSDAYKNSGIKWNEQTFEEYIKDPRAKIPGTKMIFAGIKNEQQAKDMWAYI
jgi:cytochrome c